MNCSLTIMVILVLMVCACCLDYLDHLTDWDFQRISHSNANQIQSCVAFLKSNSDNKWHCLEQWSPTLWLGIPVGPRERGSSLHNLSSVLMCMPACHSCKSSSTHMHIHWPAAHTARFQTAHGTWPGGWDLWPRPNN